MPLLEASTSRLDGEPESAWSQAPLVGLFRQSWVIFPRCANCIPSVNVIPFPAVVVRAPALMFGATKFNLRTAGTLSALPNVERHQRQ